VIVGGNDDLLRRSCFVEQVNWISVERLLEPTRVQVKIRNKHVPADATIVPTSDRFRAEVHCDQPQRAITPGQGAVFYQGDLVVGGGWIE
jgi:tRNA-specific 2-thiouridylase